MTTMKTTAPTAPTVAQGDEAETDYSRPVVDDFEVLARDAVPVRSMREDDLAAMVAIDRKHTGRDRTPYFQDKMAEALRESGIRISLVAELEGRVAGFVMARLDYGEFGHTEPEAVIDTIGVAPAFTHRQVGRALVSQLLTNLHGLRVEGVRTEVAWDNFALLHFLEECGFRPSQRLAFSRSLR